MVSTSDLFLCFFDAQLHLSVQQVFFLSQTVSTKLPTVFSFLFLLVVWLFVWLPVV